MDTGAFGPEALEPLPGIAPLSGALEAFAYVAAERKALVRQGLAPKTPPVIRRTVGTLRARAAAIRVACARLDTVKQRGESVWQEIENEIDRRNAPAYDRAASLLVDLRTIAEETGSLAPFRLRLDAIRTRHARKERFIDRLKALEQDETP